LYTSRSNRFVAKPNMTPSTTPMKSIWARTRSSSRPTCPLQRTPSLLRIHDLATKSECGVLLEKGLANAKMAFKSRPSTACHMPGRVRMPVEDFLAEPELQLCDQILRRTLARLSAELPGLTKRQMGNASDPACIIGNRELQFSNGEPAINVYRVGGYFKPHEDKMSLTVLIPLSDAASGAFTGGGTAFWSDLDRSPVNIRPATFTVQAPAGTALVFTGNVTHGAMPVLSGERTVFVASFGPQTCVAKGSSSSSTRLVEALAALWRAARR